MLFLNARERNKIRMEIEGTLIYQLNNIIDIVKNSPTINDIGHAQHLYGVYVESALRKGTVQAYDLGDDYVSSHMKFYGVTESEMMEEADLANKLATEYGSKYWRKVDTLLHRNDVLLQKYDYEPRSPLNSNYMATSTAIGIVTKALALGTRNKLKQIHLHNLKLKAGSATPRRSNTQLEQGERDETHDQLEWDAVMDNNTCDVCQGLDGQFFDFEDPDMPEPADACEGGDNCRCTLNVVEATSLIVYSDEEDFIP